MSDSANYIFLNGDIIREEIATIPAVSSGLYYGAGCFETFLSEHGKIFRFEDHIDRLNGGLNYLGVAEPFHIQSESILKGIHELLTKNDLLRATTRIRIQVSLQEKKGYSASDEHSPIILITADEVEKEHQPQKLILSQTRVVPSVCRPSQFKLSNMLHYRYAYREAEQRGADDAILLTSDGFVAETSIANIFWKNEDGIFTSAKACDILPGIMRNSIIKVLRTNMQMKVHEGKFGIDELLKAETVWITNSAVDFVPVMKIEETSFETGRRFFSELGNQLTAYKEKNMADV